MYLDNIDDHPRWPDDAAVILSCPFPAKLFPLRTIFSRWTNRDLRQCSAHGSETSERNSDEVYLFVDSIAIITVCPRFLVMAQRSTRRSTMRREVHAEKCAIQNWPRPRDARAAAKIRHHLPFPFSLSSTFVIAHQIRSGSTLAGIQTSLPHARGFHGLTMPSA